MPLSRSSTTVIHLHPAAPDKPLAGTPCNGCGVCCALETCPLARLRYWRSAGPCPALSWSPATGRYLCGLLATPGKLLPMLPESLHPILQKIVRRWIAAGHGCDCNAEVTPPAN